MFRLRRYRPECVEIDLRPLSPPDTASLIRAVHSHRTITDEQVRRLVEQSAGVPLYAESLAVEDGAQRIRAFTTDLPWTRLAADVT